MPQPVTTPPFSEPKPVTDILHGVPVTDPYRWLEDPDSLATRLWIDAQTQYARNYLAEIPGRNLIRKQIEKYLAVENYDSVQKVGSRYFFRKRPADQEQHCIFFREGECGEDQLLLDPAERGNDPYTAVIPVRVSPDGRFLLYEVKQGGERTGTFELLDIHTRQRLPDVLPRGYLRGFGFTADSTGFYYVHEREGASRPTYRAAYLHSLGTPFETDEEIFFAGEDEKLRLSLLLGSSSLIFLVYKYSETKVTTAYLKNLNSIEPPQIIIEHADYIFSPRLIDDKLLAITDRDAPNRRIVEVRLHADGNHDWFDVVPEDDAVIIHWVVAGDHLFVSYLRGVRHQIAIFDFHGNRRGEIPLRAGETVALLSGLPGTDEVLLESESFTEPASIFRYSFRASKRTPWTNRSTPIDAGKYRNSRSEFLSKDGTLIPIYLVGRSDVLEKGDSPTIMTSYGGFGVSSVPQFSVLVAFLIERGCLFALPSIRGGSEFGINWHNSAKRRKRQTAFDDFLSAAEWLIKTGRTSPSKLAIFGGSNSGLLVAAALTQRPDLFRAVLCMVPLLDMLRYHLFDCAFVWKEEYGIAEDADDFKALLDYSPYHHVHPGKAYPATMIVSGDADRNCNSLHARKMTARLQAANTSPLPVFLDYTRFRGHSPVLPLTQRIEALTDRLAFLCDQLQLPL